jgi:hypothetical protein
LAADEAGLIARPVSMGQAQQLSSEKRRLASNPPPEIRIAEKSKPLLEDMRAAA